MNHLIRIRYPMGGVVSRNWVLTCVYFVRQLNLLKKNMGIPGVVKYLKVCAVLMQQVVSGYKLSDLTGLGLRVSRSKGGLPRIIPAMLRKEISKGNKKVIQEWLTLFNIYRDLHFKGELKIKTIIGPSTATSRSSQISKYLDSFVRLYFRESDRNFDKPAKAFLMLSSGPQATKIDGEYNSHPDVVMRSLRLLSSKKKYSALFNALKAILTDSKSWDIINLMNQLQSTLRNSCGFEPKNDYLGRLSIKEEAAGKVRVFAMVDP